MQENVHRRSDKGEPARNPSQRTRKRHRWTTLHKTFHSRDPHLRSSFFVGVLVWAALDLGFGITFSSVVRYLLAPVVLLCLVLSILDYRSDD